MVDTLALATSVPKLTHVWLIMVDVTQTRSAKRLDLASGNADAIVGTMEVVNSVLRSMLVRIGKA